MRKRLSILGVAVLLFSVVLVAPSSATPPLDVTIELITVFPEGGAPYGTFTATGPAVDAGLMCGSGTEGPLLEKGAGNSGRVVNVQVVTQFTCGDGPFAGDTFAIKAQLHAELTGGPPTWTINWVVTDGTGAFTALHGSGNGSGEYTGFDPRTITDIYTGGLH